MKVVVFGGTGPTGALVVQQALLAGCSVRLLARTPEKVTLRDPNLTVVAGDALSPEHVTRAVAGMDAVVCTLGVPYTWKEVCIYSEAARLMVDAMATSGVRRLIAVTSGGTHPGHDPNTAWFFEILLKPSIGRTPNAADGGHRDGSRHRLHHRAAFAQHRPPRVGWCARRTGPNNAPER